jgi:hypothetical protein
MIRMLRIKHDFGECTFSITPPALAQIPFWRTPKDSSICRI